MSDAKTRSVPPTVILAAPAGVYLTITGTTAYGWTWAETGVAAGGSFLVLLFVVPLAKGAAAAQRASARRAKARKAAAKAKAEADAEAAKKNAKKD